MSPLQAEEPSIKRYSLYISKWNEWQWLTQQKKRSYPVLKIYLGAISWGCQTHMLGRAPTLGPQGFQLLCWFLLSERPSFPNTTEETTPQTCSSFPLNTNPFYFSEKHCMFWCSVSWSLWHVKWVISPSGCNCHHEAFNKFKKQHQDQGTNGLGDELLIIWDYLIQLEPFDSQDAQTQPIPQLRHPNKPLEYFRVLAVACYKISSQFHIKWCQGKVCFSSSPKLLGVQLHTVVIFCF